MEEGVSDTELFNILIPHPFIKEIHDLIQNETKIIIELEGAKGRGKTHKNPNNTLEITFPLPKNNQPATTKIKDAQVYWRLVMKVQTIFDLYLNYKTEFTVTKEKLLS